jgi:hypothetical protein
MEKPDTGTGTGTGIGDPAGADVAMAVQQTLHENNAEKEK